MKTNPDELKWPSTQPDPRTTWSGCRPAAWALGYPDPQAAHVREVLGASSYAAAASSYAANIANDANGYAIDAAAYAASYAASSYAAAVCGLNNLLLRLDACEDAREWGNTQPDLRTAWSVCQRADWMLWLAARLLPRKIVTLAACDCAETAVHLIEDGGLQMNALLSLHIAREWAEGREDLETVRAASSAVSSAAYVSYATAAAAAAYAAAAAWAATAAASYAAAANTPLASADSAASYVAAAAYAAHAVQKDAAISHMADLVRTCISADMICEVSK